MKAKPLCLIVALVALVTLAANLAQAEDGVLFRRNISKTPEHETEKAAIYMMDFYVPAQASTGEVKPVANYCLDEDLDNPWNEDGTCVGEEAYEPRDYAKPLVSVYIDDIGGGEATPEGMLGIQGGITFGHFDAFVAVSLDDGTSWRNENLSRSSNLSSFTLANGYVYPGDVHAVVHQVAEDKILAVWASKYCQSGFPLYSLVPEDNADYLTDLETNYGKNALYLYDLFGVAGPQGSVNYTEQGFPEIGEIPYSCIWTARGKLLPGDDPMTADFVEATHVVWTAPERLTSGVRDANLPAVDCAKNAGCALTWQEDPAGLRPGKGLGPGEGWSGAIVNAKTDIWYSYITFADFDLVFPDGFDTTNPPDEPMLIEDYETEVGDSMDRPKPYVPMAMPVRLTDNDMCKATSGTNGAPEDPFCWIDFDSIDDLDHSNITTFLDGLTGPEEGADFCASTVTWTNPGGTELPICVTEDGRWMIGRVGSSRVRMVIKPYTPEGAPDHDGDGTPDASAWLSLGAEETKALGITAVVDGTEYDPIDIGKDMFYYSFDYAKPYNLHVNTTLDTDDASPYIVQQGGMLNQPAKCSPWFATTTDTNPYATCPADGEFFDVQIDPITGYEYYLTEISRRFAMTLNNIPNITNPEINASGLSGILIYKQGVIWQGGPADIMLRRLVIPELCNGTLVTEDCFDPTVDNPFAFENMECDEWLYTDGSNPNYLKGLCMSPAINISGTTIEACTTGGADNDACAEAFPVAEDGSIPDDIPLDQFPKVLEWRQCDGASAIEGCEVDNDLDDQSWENPFDVAKGHRGFLYGDMVMMMYAWSPNWQANAVGNDHYNLYQRRSFDGGLTWTTTPAELGGAGLDALEFYYGETIGDFVPYIWTYGAGEFEQGRNLSLLHGNKVTILDPRYSPPGGLKQYPTIRTDWLEANADLINFSSDDVLPYPDDLTIDPSKYYLVYETGDNTTVTEGEAVPLDLFYSRATVYGDIFEWFDYVNDDQDDILVEPRWPWLENQTDDLSGEASVVMNPGGTFVYNVWNQWKEEILPDGHELVYDSDIWFRRLLYNETVDAEPTASILYVSTEAWGRDFEETGQDEYIIFLGAGKDNDRLGEGIVNYAWSTDLGFVEGAEALAVADDDPPGQADFCNSPDGKECQKPGWAFVNGKHSINFKVQDDEGNWSTEKTIILAVADTLEEAEKMLGSKVYLPIIVR